VPIATLEDYRTALHRLAELLSLGVTAENSREVATLEGEIAEYVVQHGEPDFSLGRPGGKN
jgi:hypothetical protein